MELTGSSVFDYIHASDRAELAEQLGMKLPPSRTMSQSSAGTGNSDGYQSSPMESPTSPHGERKCRQKKFFKIWRRGNVKGMRGFVS